MSDYDYNEYISNLIEMNDAMLEENQKDYENNKDHYNDVFSLYYWCMCSFGKEIDASEDYCPGDKAIWCDYVKTEFYNKYGDYLFEKFNKCLYEDSLANNPNKNTKEYNELLEELKRKFVLISPIEVNLNNLTKGYLIQQTSYGITKIARNDRLDSLLFTEEVYINDKNLNSDETKIWKQCFKECLIKLGGDSLLKEYKAYLTWLKTEENVLSTSFSCYHSAYNDLLYYSERLIKLCEELFPLVSEKYYTEKKEKDNKQRRDRYRHKIKELLKYILIVILIMLVMFLLYHFLGF